MLTTDQFAHQNWLQKLKQSKSIEERDETWRRGLGRSQQKYSRERIASVHLGPKTKPTKRLQETKREMKRHWRDRRKQKNWKREREREIQKVIVSAESEEVVNALNESALEDWPTTTEEWNDDQRSYQTVTHQNPLYAHSLLLQHCTTHRSSLSSLLSLF